MVRSRDVRPTLFVLALWAVAPSPRTAWARPAWSHETLGAVWAAPLVGRDGRIYVGSEDSFLYAFEDEGRLRWVYKASEGFSGWPVWLGRGRLAVGNRNGTVYVFDEEGTVRHKVGVEGIPLGRPAVDRDRIYQGTTAGKLVAVGREGLLWVHDTESPVTSYPAAQRGKVFVGCKDGALIALDARGNRLWRVVVDEGVALRGGIVAGPKAVVVATEKGLVVALSVADGRSLWRRPLEQPQRGGLAPLDRTGAVVLGTQKGKLVALDAKGEPRFELAADGPVSGTPEVSGGRILFGTDRGTLYVVDGRGDPLGLYPVGGAIKGGVTLGKGRRALFGSTDRRIYSIPLDGAGRWRHSPRLKQALLRTPPARRLWRRDLSGPVACGVGPAPGGGLLAGTWGNRMFLLEADGKVRWSYNCGADIDTLPVADQSGAVAFGCNDGGFYGLKPDGDLRYRLPVNKALSSSPAATRDGTVYFGARDRRIYSLDREGKLRWKIRTGGDVDSSPRISRDGVVYVGSDDRHLYAIDPLGHIVWYRKLPGAIRSRPALGQKGNIHVTSMDQRLHTLTPDGHPLWSYQTEGQSVSWPVVDADGAVYFGSRDHDVHAVDPEGKQRWRFSTADEVDSHPALSPDGKLLFVGSDDGNLYALDTERGALRWWYPARTAIRGGLVARDDGSVVFGTMDGAVIAVAPPDPAAKPPPASPAHVRFLVGQGRFGPPTVLADGTLVVAGVDGKVRAFGPDRWPLWTVPVGRDRLERPAVVERPNAPPLIFVTDARGDLAGLSDGTLRFRLRLDREPLSPPAVAATPDGPLVLVGTRSGRLWAVTTAGKVRWFYSGDEAVTRAALALNRTVLVPAGHTVTGLDLSGHRRFQVKLPAGLGAGPVAVSPSRALAGDGLGHLWAVSAAGAVVWKRDLGAGIRRIAAVPGEDSATVLTADGRVVVLAVTGELLLEQAPPLPPVEIAPTSGDVTYLVAANGTLLGLDRRTGAVSRELDLSSHETHAAPAPEGGAVVITDDGWVTRLRPKKGNNN